MDKQIVHVVGGGLVGPLTAIFLAKKGIDVELYERRGDIRKGNVDVGRSINLVITDRGLKALDEVGIKDKALEIAIPMRGRMLHDKRGNLKQVPYGQRKNEVINAISRGLLNSLLLEEADKHENINIHFHKQCTGYDLETKKLTFHDESSKKTETIDTDIVIGTDGAWSAIRKAFLDNLMNFSYSQSFLEHSYKELIIPPGENDEFRIEDSFLHIWPRENFMLIALPNIDGSFTCTLFYPREGENSFAELKSKESITAFFESEFPDALDVMPTLCEDELWI
jgi:kynurenine 3-monooxygenase